MLNTLKQWWQQRHRTQQQHAELAGMTERDWSDLGAGRSEMDYWLAQQARAERVKPGVLFGSRAADAPEVSIH